MKFLSLLAVVVLFLGIGVSSASAQNGAFAPYADFGITASGTGGGTGTFLPSNPNYRIGGGIESSTTHLLFDINTQFDTAHLSLKNIGSATSGYTGTVTGSAYLKLDSFLVGGGAFYSNQTVGIANFFNGFNRSQIRPFVGGGYQFSRDRILANYVLPGQDQIGVAPNLNLGDRTFQIRNEFFLGKSGLVKHLRLTQNLDLSNNILDLTGTRQTTYTTGVGLKFVF